MKGISYKLATFSFAAMLLASCSDNSSNSTSAVADATIVGSEVKSITDAQELASRVTNYKGAYESTTTANARTRSAAAKAIRTRAANSVPAGAKNLADVFNDSPWNKHTGDYLVSENTTVDGTTNGQNLNIEGMTIYVKGTFIYDGAFGSNATINILPGGKLVARNSNEVFADTKITNEGSIEFPKNQSTYIIKNEFYNCAGNLDLGDAKLDFQGASTTRMHVSGDLKAKEISINGSQMIVEGNATTEKFYMTVNGSYCNIGGTLTTTNQGEDVYNNYSLKLDNSAKLEVGCAIKSSGVVYITNQASIQTLYLKATNYKQDSNAKLILKDQSMVDIAGDFKNLNNGSGTADISDKNGVAVIKANKIYYNAPGKQGDWSAGGAKTVDCSIFTTSGDNAHMIIEAKEGIYGSEWTTDKITNDNTTIVWNNGANIHWYTDDDAKNYVVKKSACNPEGYNDVDTPVTPDPTPTPDPDAPETNNKPSLDLISTIDYDTHDHDISATCIQPINGRLYMSYHTRGTGHGGCVEVFSEVENNKVSLLQYLYDAQRDLDFNHLLATKLNSGQRMLYLPGSSFKKGAMLAYMPILDNHLLDTESKSITTTIEGKDTVIYQSPLQFVQLQKAIAGNGSADENCVVYNEETNHLIVMTTKGYKVYDATTWETIYTIDKPGKAKHVAIGNGKIVALHFDKQATEGASQELPATIEVFDQKKEDMENPDATFSISTIKPNNGKNVVQVKDNMIYVCRGAAGIYCYDMQGNEQWHYQMPKPLNEKNEYKAYANGCWIGDKYDYVAYGSYGLVVLDKNTHEPIAYRHTPKSANYVVEYNGYIYVAYGQSRLQVFKLQNAE